MNYQDTLFLFINIGENCLEEKTPLEYGIKYIMGGGCGAGRKGTAGKEVGKLGCSFEDCDPVLLSVKFRGVIGANIGKVSCGHF